MFWTAYGLDDDCFNYQAALSASAFFNRYFSSCSRTYLQTLMAKFMFIVLCCTKFVIHSLTSWTLESSMSIGIYSYKARSCISSYQDNIGMPHSGYSMYEVGELSMIIASFMLRPSDDMSLTNTPFTKEQCSLKRRFVLYRFGSI